MLDFAKSIMTGNSIAENYDPKDYEDNPRHKWTIKAIENEIQKYKQRLESNRVRIMQLRNMENSGQYGSLTSRDLKEEQREYDANQMKIKQLVSMLHRATGNSMVGNALSEYDIVFRGHSVPDDELRKFTPAQKNELKREYEDLLRQGVISRAEYNDMLQALKKIGNSRVGNATIKFYGETIDLTKESETNLKEILEELQMMHEQSDAQRAIKEELKRRQTGNSKIGNGALDWQIVTPTCKSAKYKMGQTVKVDGEQGTITKIQPMKLSDTPTYKIRMKSGKEIWRYEEEIGNKKVGNGITKFGVGTKVIAEGHKAQVTYESVERGPNGIPFGWVRVVFIEGPWKGQTGEYYDYDLKRA